MTHAPDSLAFRLVYDAAAAGYTDWTVPATPLPLLAVVGLLLYVHVREKRPRHEGIVLYLGVAVLLVFIVSGFWLTYPPYVAMRDALRDGRFTVVEGIVRDFEPGDGGDHRPESWHVESGGRVYAYRYSPSIGAPGYRQTAAHGGMVREGVRVRVADVAGDIARLEVAR